MPTESEEKTLRYYQDHAEAFCENTESVPFDPIRLRFEKKLPAGSRILDFGCGSGRDALAFDQNGFRVTALDGTKAFTERLQSRGIQTILSDFASFEFPETYEGIWACASLLHLEKPNLELVVSRIFSNLEPGGVFYCSMKKKQDQSSQQENKDGSPKSADGEFRHGRFFLDQTAASLRQILMDAGFPQEGIELFETEDARPEQKGKFWINAIAVKPGKAGF